MSKIINICTSIAISAIVVACLLLYLVSGISTTKVEDDGSTTVFTGIYNVLGSVPVIEKADKNTHSIPEDAFVNKVSPIVKYTNLILNTGVDYCIEQLVTVEINNVVYDGFEGITQGFFVNLIGVEDKNGRSVLTQAKYDITKDMQDINISCLYNTSDNTLTFFSDGTYTIKVKIDTNYGKSAIVSFKVPVTS